MAYILTLADHPAYASALRELDLHVTGLARARLTRALHRLNRGWLPELREFDLISGLTGLGAYLQLRSRHDALVREVLSYLVQLTEPVTINKVNLPGWWSGNGPRDGPSPDWPDGHANTGMAHGISGPLALLSTTMIKGVTVPGQAEAISRICEALDRLRLPGGWPGLVTFEEWSGNGRRHKNPRQRPPERPSWCYGTPGIARAHQLAAIALGDDRRKQVAERALLSCVANERNLALLRDASVCHGWAGVIQTVRRVAADADADELSRHIPRLIDGMAHHLIEHEKPREHGLLEGLAGIQLVQDDLATARAQSVPWDTCLLLDGPSGRATHQQFKEER